MHELLSHLQKKCGSNLPRKYIVLQVKGMVDVTNTIKLNPTSF
jgi:hypothetical protein